MGVFIYDHHVPVFQPPEGGLPFNLESNLAPRRTTDAAFSDQKLQVNVEQSKSVIWKGTVNLPNVGQFSSLCKQIAGPPIWDLCEVGIGPNMTIIIEGRVCKKSAEEYLKEHIALNRKEIIAIEFIPGDLPAGEKKEISSMKGFMSIFNYFDSRDRYAVFARGSSFIKDAYMIPVRKYCSVPKLIAQIKSCSMDSLIAENDRIIGVMVSNKK